MSAHRGEFGSVTRRKLLSGGVALAVTSGAFWMTRRPCASVVKLLGKSDNLGKFPGLSLLTPSDEDFAPSLRQSFGDLHYDSLMSQSLHMSVLVKSTNARPVKACSIQWNITGQDGVTVPLVYGFMGRPYHLAKAYRSGQQPLLQQTQACLVSPFSWRSADEVASSPRLDDLADFLVDQTSQRAQTLLLHLNDAVMLGSNLDAAIYENDDGSHSLHGVDRAGLGERFMIARDAERDEAASVLKDASRRQHAEGYGTILKAHIHASKDVTSLPLVHKQNAIYFAARTKYAKALYRYLTVTDAQSLTSLLYNVSLSDPGSVARA